MNMLASWVASLADHGPAILAVSLLAKITLLLAVAWTMHALLSRFDPRWQVLLWRSTGVGLMLLIALTACPPLFQWAVLPGEAAETALRLSAAVPGSEPAITAAPAPARSTAGAPRIAESRTATLRRDFATRVLDAPAREEQPPILITSGAGSAHGEAGSPATRRREDSTERAAVSERFQAQEPSPAAAAGRITLAVTAGLVLWLAGVLVLVGSLPFAWRRLSALLARTAAVPAWVEEEAAAVRARLGCDRALRVRQTAEVRTPCLFGLRRPVVILPERQCDLAHRGDLTAVLAHEAAHVKGHDLVWNVVLHAVSMLLWFHPLAWRIRSAHGAACDGVADAIAADYLGDVARYGRILARLAVRMNEPHSAAVLAMARTSHVRRRIVALQRKLFRGRLPRRQAAGAVVLGMICIAILGAVALTRAHADPDPQVAGNVTPAAQQGTAQSGDPAPPASPAAAAAEPETAVTSSAPVDETETNHNRLTVHVSATETGKPLAAVKLRFHGRIASNRYDRQLETDEQGVASIEWDQGAKINNLWMDCKKGGFVPVHYTWRSDHRAIELPRELRLRLTAGQSIGGVVRDEQDRPIAGATVEITMPVSWPKLANHVFRAGQATTDAAGRWQWDSAPPDLGSTSVRVSHPDYILAGGRKNTSLDAVTVLKQGPRITGLVVDQEGQPVAGARVIAGFNDWGERPTDTTDAEGRFVLKNCELGKSAVTVQADEFSPALKEITIATENDPLQFRLEPGHLLRVRVVDTQGQPLAGALVAPESWRGYHTVNNRMNTDAEGRCKWTGAPAEGVEYSILKDGFMSQRDFVIKASGDEHLVTLHPLLVISGGVSDAATGAGVQEFRIRVGHDYTGRDTYWSRDEPVPYTGGSYRYTFDEPIDGGYLLQVVAAGYLPATSRAFGPHEGGVRFDFRLTPGSGPSGRVATPTGEPAEAADVGLATAESRAMLDNGHFDRSQNSAEVVKTDAEGRFNFLPRAEDEPYLLIVLHESGYAELTREQLEESSEIRLQPWGRVEGQVLLGDTPDASREVSFWPRRPNRSFRFVFSYGYQLRTDKQGRFEFDRVIPGPGTVSRVLVTQFLSSWQHAPGWHQPVDIDPGETVRVTIGGTGQAVAGQLVLDRQPDVEIDWTTNEPATVERWDVENNQADENHFRCLGNIDKAGRFLIPDVPPGDYELDIPVNNPPTPNSCGAGQAIGRAKLRFTVPELPGGRSDEALDLGVVTAELFDTLDPGELAPDFVAENLAGGQFRLSSLHGKLVLLDFWATWCGPCLAEIPGFKEIQAEFGDDPRFALLSVSCDNEIAAPREYLGRNHLSWAQTHVTGMSASVLQDYTVRTLPATFLIGPDGTVMAKNIRGTDLKRAVAAALGDDELFRRAATSTRPPRFPLVRFEVDEAPPPLAERPALVLLDDADPDFSGGGPHHDRLRLFGESGRELWSRDGFNNCETVGAIHGVVVDLPRQRIYARELVSDRLTAWNLLGQKLWQLENVAASALAVDPTTGNLWVTGGPNLKQGETVVFDPAGRELAAFPFCGIDMVFDPHTDAFWLTGYELIKLNRQGEVLFRRPVDGWCCPSVSVNPADGSVWTVEREHPDVVRSKNRLWILNADGSPRNVVELAKYEPFVVEFDPVQGGAWLGTYAGGIRRVSPLGVLGAPLPIQALNISINSAGEIWVHTDGELLGLDASGAVLSRIPYDHPSSQAWLVALD